MQGPVIPPGIEKAYQLFGLGINRGDVGAFLAVACRASPSQVPRHCWTAMLARNDVVRFMRNACIRVVQQGVFATAIGPPANEGAQSGGNMVANRRFFFPARILAFTYCSSISISSNWLNSYCSSGVRPPWLDRLSSSR